MNGHFDFNIDRGMLEAVDEVYFDIFNHYSCLFVDKDVIYLSIRDVLTFDDIRIASLNDLFGVPSWSKFCDLIFLDGIARFCKVYADVSFSMFVPYHRMVSSFFVEAHSEGISESTRYVSPPRCFHGSEHVALFSVDVCIHADEDVFIPMM